MRWWCSAQSLPWDWTWRPYLGVWLVVALLAAIYLWSRRGSAQTERRGRVRGGLYWLGLFLLWCALDWPIGALGGGYLASAHMLQFLLVGLLAPALMLLGLPASFFDRLRRRPRVLSLIRFVTAPLLALALYNAVMVFTHLPRLVDAWMPSQLGSFAIDALWFGAGLVFWWPVTCPVPVRPRFPDLVRVAYLFGNTIIAGFIALILVFSEYPVYGVFELAPPVSWLSSGDDQQVAGVLMKVGGALILWTAMTIVFFRWYGRENREAHVADREGFKPAT